MRIFYITANNGDGSFRTEFYDSKECIDRLTDDDLCLEEYTDGDGGSWGSFEIPDDTPVSGITIKTINEVEEYIAAVKWYE